MNKTVYRQYLALVDTLLIDLSKAKRMLPLLEEGRSTPVRSTLVHIRGLLNNAITELGGVRDAAEKEHEPPSPKQQGEAG